MELAFFGHTEMRFEGADGLKVNLFQNTSLILVWKNDKFIEPLQVVGLKIKRPCYVDFWILYSWMFNPYPTNVENRVSS